MDLNEKQALLLEEIVNQNYDPEQFQKFLENIKPGFSHDIDSWTLNELIDAVNRFKNKPVEIDLQETQEAQIVEKPIQKEYYKTLQCKQLQFSLLGQTDDLNIKIDGYERVGTGFFSSGYIAYNIITEPQQWKAQRKYQDFQQLREILVKMNPGLAIPLIQDIKTNKKQNDYQYNRICDYLQRFLTFIRNVPELLNNSYFELFLSLSTDKDWQNAFKVAHKQEKVKRIDEVTTLSGDVVIRINKEMNQYYDRSETFLNQVVPQIKRARKLSKQLTQEMSRVQNTMYELSDSFQKINLAAASMSSEDQKTFIPEFSKSIESLMTKWGDFIGEQGTLVDLTFCRTLKFTQFQFQQLIELIQNRDTAEQEYIDFQQKLNAKKEKLFQSGDITKWDIQTSHSLIELRSDKPLAFQHMLPKENYYARELKDIFGFYNNRVFEQIQQILRKGFQISDFQNFVKDQSLGISQLHQLWADAITNLYLIQDQSI